MTIAIPPTYVSACTGIGGFDLALDRQGFRCLAQIENDKACLSVLRYRWPDVPKIKNLADAGRHNLPFRPTLLTGGVPCFPEGTLIITREGFVDIRDVKVGDEVLSHTGYWRRVVSTMHRTADTIRLKGQGHPGLVTTAEHPFWSTRYEHEWIVGSKKTTKGGAYRKNFESPRWRSAQEMRGNFWASPTCFPPLPIPPVESKGRETSLNIQYDDNFFWLMGFWCGNGYLQDQQRPDRSAGQTFGKICFTEGKREIAPLVKHLDLSGWHYRDTEERTAMKFFVQSVALARWIKIHFGEYAYGKRLPVWLLGQPENLRRSFYEGYCTADGSPEKSTGVMRSTSVSWSLTLGMKLLALSLGYSCSIIRHIPKPKSLIEGREVNQRPTFTLHADNNARSSICLDTYRFGLVRKIEVHAHEQEVFNLEVETDQSYIADGIAVHNCQPFSLAGLRQSLKDERANVAFHFLRIANEIRPEYIWIENVPGLLNTEDNAFGYLLAGLVGHDAALVSILPGGRWPDAGMAVGPRRAACWRTLDSQFFGVPQRRRRVYVVAHLAAACACEILFERKGLLGNFEAGLEAGPVTSGEVGDGAVGDDRESEVARA